MKGCIVSVDISVLTGVLGISVVSSTIMKYYRRWTNPAAGIHELNELIGETEKEQTDHEGEALLPAFVQTLRNERDELRAYYVVYRRLIDDRAAVNVPGGIVQSLICMFFAGMVLPSLMIVFLDVGDDGTAFPILFAGSCLGLAVSLLCVPISRGRRISELFDQYSSTDRKKRRECGVDPGWDESDIERIVEKARCSRKRYEYPRWILGLTMAVMMAVYVCHACGVYRPEVAMYVILADSVAFLAALAVCCSSNTSSAKGRQRTRAELSREKPSKESKASNRDIGTCRAGKARECDE